MRDEINRLLRRLADGDRDAMRPAFDALWPIVRRFTSRALACSPDAEDAAQMTLLKIFEQVADYDRERDGLAWAFAIASFECRTLRKRAARRRETGPVDVTSRSLEEEAIENDLVLAVREALVDVSDEDRRIILAAMEDDRETGSTFRKRLSRALARLRVVWRAKHEIGD